MLLEIVLPEIFSFIQIRDESSHDWTDDHLPASRTHIVNRRRTHNTSNHHQQATNQHNPPKRNTKCATLLYPPFPTCTLLSVVCWPSD